MELSIHPQPAVVVIFGAGGDLTWRKLVPALYDLFLEKWLPSQFAVIGVGRKAMSLDDFRRRSFFSHRVLLAGEVDSTRFASPHAQDLLGLSRAAASRQAALNASAAEM